MIDAIHVKKYTRVKKGTVPNLRYFLQQSAIKYEIQRPQNCSHRSWSRNSDLRIRGAGRNIFGSAPL